jgi:serine protease Do
LSGLAVVAAAGGALLILPQQRVHAQQLSQGVPLSFADLVDRVKPAVVSIQVSNTSRLARNVPRGRDGRREGPDDRRWPGPGDIPLPFPDDSPLREFFKKGIPQRPLQSQGAGFVVSADGYVVTNNHVVVNANKVQVVFDKGSKYEAEVIGTDSRTDLALLKIKAEGKTFPYVTFAKTLPRVGEWVVAVGNPFGLSGTVTAGIVSAHGREVSGPYDFIQIDAAVNKGNSGGPSFNLQGEVVGVNTAIYSPTGGSVGIAFAIPAKTAREVIAQLKQHGSVRRGWLGVKIQSLDETTAASLGLSEAKGALVSDVFPGPAADAGVKNGDTILAVNGIAIADSRDLARTIAGLVPDSKVELRIRRARSQKEETVQVKLGLMPSTQELGDKRPPTGRPTQPTELQQLGLSVAPPTGPSREGLVVTEVDPDTDAAQKIRVGDTILEINFHAVSRTQDLVDAVREANRLERKAVLLRVRSGSETRFVAVQLRKD